MRIKLKAGMTILALTLGVASMFAQGGPQGGPPQGPPSPGRGNVPYGGQSGGQFGGPDGGEFGARGPAWFGRWPGERRGMRRGGRERGMEMGDGEARAARLLRDPAIRERLGITTDQTAKMRQQESDFRKTEIRDRADLQIKRIDLDELLSSANPNRAAIDAKLQEVGAAQLALEKAAIDLRLNVRDILTPAQRDRLRQLITEPKTLDGNVRTGGPQGGGRGGQRGGPGGGRGAGPGAAPAPNAQGQAPPPNR